MFDPKLFRDLILIGDFTIVDVELVSQPMVDPIGRSALAKTEITGREFHLTLSADMSEKELSVSLYHEILEAMTVATDDPPESVVDFNEGDFEEAAYKAHEVFGSALPSRVNQMLRSYGFRNKISP